MIACHDGAVHRGRQDVSAVSASRASSGARRDTTATPDLVPPGAMGLEPSLERRRIRGSRCTEERHGGSNPSAPAPHWLHAAPATHQDPACAAPAAGAAQADGREDSMGHLGAHVGLCSFVRD